MSKFREYHAPLGCELKGVYNSTAGPGPYDVAWIWDFSRFRDIDSVYELGDPVIERLQDEESDFYIPETANTVILEEIRDAELTARAKLKKPKKQIRADSSPSV